MACHRRACLLIFVVYGVAIIDSNMEDRSKDVLRFVSVVFRHGSRTPASLELPFLSNDGRFSDNFYPVGLGGLTNEGKQLIYKLGTELRKRYDNFLGDVYFPDHVEARSTDYPRTKMSLDLVLAGLYPPSEVQMWSPTLKWQPIPFISLPLVQDTLLSPTVSSPTYLKEVSRVELLPEIAKKTEGFRPLAKKLSNLIGKPVANVTEMWYLYSGLMALKSMNLTVPEWADDLFPNGALLDASLLQYEIYNYNDVLKKHSGGVLLKKIINDMKTTIKSGNATNTQKISLFSAHDVNIVSVLYALGLFKPHMPEYSSAVIIELIERNGDYYVKVIYYLGIPDVFEEQEISDYGTHCPFDKFLDLTKSVIPLDKEIDRIQDCKSGDRS